MPGGPQTFGLKQLRFTFTLNTNARFKDGSNTLQISALRALADITYPGPPSWPSMTAHIFGMALSDMQALTGLTFQVLSYRNNSVLVEANAGNGQGWNTIFYGTLVKVVPDFNQAPDVSLSIYSQALAFEQFAPVPPTSYATAAVYADVIRTIVTKMGRTLQNQGVTGQFAGPIYFPGTASVQLQAACDKAGITAYVDQPGLVVITPTGMPRGNTTVVLTPATGLIGYPTLDSLNLIGVRAFFNPGLAYGGSIQIANSDQVGANGDWVIFDCTHRLSSLVPNGPWFTEMTAQPTQGFVNTPP
jgi:baseplate hub protein gp41